MTRTRLINLCLALTIIAVGGAMAIKVFYGPPGRSGGGMGGDAFILLSPLFFVIAAKRATRFGGAAIVLALLGLAFAGLGLFGAVQMLGKQESAGELSPGRR